MQHDWHAVIIYKLTEEQAGELQRTDALGDGEPDETHAAVLEPEQIVEDRSSVGCMTCTLSWGIAEGHPCPGEPIGVRGPGRAPVFATPDALGVVDYDEWLALQPARS